MFQFMKLSLLLSILSAASASCPNACSGHGTCGVDDVCTCYAGWGMGGNAGGDCSDRFCPYELAWIDEPLSDGSTNNYAECSNKGVCDRSTGLCTCFAGYQGKSCSRQACPGDCSGHGTCKYKKDLSFGIVYNEYYDGSTNALSGLGVGGKKFSHHSWDGNRARTCVCDGGWSGLACDQRTCPVGNDITDVIPNFDENSNLGMPGFGNEVAQVQTITLYDSALTNANFASKTFALRFTSKRNETYVTQPIKWSTTDTTLAGYIEAALMKLPNKVVDRVAVTVDSTVGANGVIIEVTFTGAAVEGKQNKLEVLQDPCKNGCNPKITGLTNILSFSTTTLSTVQITTVGSHNSYECGRRGKCDYSSGLCTCFEGYTGDTCNILTALV